MFAYPTTVYKSPQVDMGYDISDYKEIDPRYGTLTDVDELIAKLGQRGMKLMMDLVVNHTSDQVCGNSRNQNHPESDYELAFLVSGVALLQGQSKERVVHLEEG
jgi:glycosidase